MYKNVFISSRNKLFLSICLDDSARKYGNFVLHACFPIVFGVLSGREGGGAKPFSGSRIKLAHTSQ